MNKNRGFTLTEVLIVISIIGILMTVMASKSTEAVATTKASNIMSNLRTMKQAAVAIFIRSRDQWEEKNSQPKVADVIDYLVDDAVYDGYDIYVRDLSEGKAASECEWYVCYKFPERAADNESIKNKISGRAESLGLRAIIVDPESQGGGFSGVSGVYTAEYRAVGLRVH